MRLLLAAIVGCCLYMAASTEAEKLSERPGFFFQLRPRLGHFAKEPFTDLYKHYAVAFLGHDVKDDNKNYLPSAEECIVYLKQLRNNKYELRDVHEFVLFDGCLGYLYQSTYHDEDKAASKYVQENLDSFVNDEKLRTVFENTNIDSFSEEAKDCVGDMLLRTIQAKKQFPGVVCNNHWLDIFTKFAECHHVLPKDSRQSDSYMNLVYDLVQRRGKSCFDNEIHLLNVAVRGEYLNNPFKHARNLGGGMFSSLLNQAATRIWPDEIMRVLLAVKQVKNINMREVHELVRGYYNNDQKLTNIFLNNVADYAIKHVDLRKKKDQKDPTGEHRYRQLIDDMCNFFRPSDREGYYDYTTPFSVMLKIISYPDVFGLDKEYFVKNVLANSFETAPLYLAISSCNLLTFTQGMFRESAPNSPKAYAVSFVPDQSKMIKWPDAGFY